MTIANITMQRIVRRQISNASVTVADVEQAYRLGCISEEEKDARVWALRYHG